MRKLFRLSVLLVLGLVPALSMAADKACDRACLQRRTVTAVDSNPRFYLDPVNGQALWFGPNEPVPNWPPYESNFPLPASSGDAR